MQGSAHSIIKAVSKEKRQTLTRDNDTCANCTSIASGCAITLKRSTSRETSTTILTWIGWQTII